MGSRHRTPTARLLSVKRRYDFDGMFFVRHAGSAVKRGATTESLGCHHEGVALRRHEHPRHAVLLKWAWPLRRWPVQ